LLVELVIPTASSSCRLYYASAVHEAVPDCPGLSAPHRVGLTIFHAGFGCRKIEEHLADDARVFFNEVGDL
jgi:hypothetical protein